MEINILRIIFIAKSNYDFHKTRGISYKLYVYELLQIYKIKWTFYTHFIGLF